MKLYALMLFLHLVAVAVWVGGMFVIHFAVRPACAELLAPPQRLPLLAAVLARFFRWVAVAVLVVIVTGVVNIVAAGGFRGAHPSVHMMLGVGLVMSIVFAHIRLFLAPRLQAAVAAGDWQAAGAMLAMIRKEVALNLVLGIATIAIATIGRAATP